MNELASIHKFINSIIPESELKFESYQILNSINLLDKKLPYNFINDKNMIDDIELPKNYFIKKVEGGANEILVFLFQN